MIQFLIKIIQNEWRSESDYPKKFIIGDTKEGKKTRAYSKKKSSIALISQHEQKKVNEVLKDKNWGQSNGRITKQFYKNNVWILVPKIENVFVIGAKWGFRNKMDESGKVVRSKARLVAQGYSQQERI